MQRQGYPSTSNRRRTGGVEAGGADFVRFGGTAASDWGIIVADGNFIGDGGHAYRESGWGAYRCWTACLLQASGSVNPYRAVGKGPAYDTVWRLPGPVKQRGEPGFSSWTAPEVVCIPGRGTRPDNNPFTG